MGMGTGLELDPCNGSKCAVPAALNLNITRQWFKVLIETKGRIKLPGDFFDQLVRNVFNGANLSLLV